MPQPDAPPRTAVTDYVARNFPGASLTPLAGDASTRRFFRIGLPDGATHILMDYGEPLDRPGDDVYFNRVFTVAELRVAEILRISPQTGCLVQEDLGLRGQREEGRGRETGADGGKNSHGAVHLV